MNTVMDQAAALRKLAAARRPVPAAACTRCHGDTGARTVWENICIALGSAGKKTLLMPLAYDSFWTGGEQAGSRTPSVMKGLYAFSRLDSPFKASSPEELGEVFSGLHPLERGMDLVLAECGYGSSSRARHLLEAAPAIFLVFTCDTPSILTAYELLKRVTIARRKAKTPTPLWLPLANKAPSLQAGAETLERFSDAARRFLGVRPVQLGALPLDPKVEEARRAGLPASVMFPHCPFARETALAAGVLMEELCRIR